MNIKIDLLEFLKKDGQEADPFYKDGMDDIFKFVEERLAGLKKAIRKEEKKKDCFVMVHLLAPEDQWHLPLEKQSSEMRITVEGYSPALTDQIYESIADGKTTVLTKRLIGADQQLN